MQSRHFPQVALSAANSAKLIAIVLTIFRFIDFSLCPICSRAVACSEPILAPRLYLLISRVTAQVVSPDFNSPLRAFAAGGPGACTRHPHFFFGPLTLQEWAALMYQHMDHHL